MNPLVLLLLLPLVEIIVFIQVGQWIGAGPTILLLVLTTIAGSLLLRRQGLTVLRKAQEMIERGETPVGAVFEGFCVVIGSALLIIPGFVTDFFGILLLIPFLRSILGRWLLERLHQNGSLHVRTVWTRTPPPSGGAPSGDVPNGKIIDVDYHEVKPDMPQLEKSRWKSDAENRDGRS